MSLLSGRGRGLLAVAALIAPAILPAPAGAQYFGRQKVQYEEFDWSVLQTDKFKVHFYASEELAARDAARMAERWYTRLSNAFQHEFDEKPLIFYADHADFQQTNVIGDLISEGTGGVTESLRNRVVMPFTGIYFENDHVLGHEMVHVFQYDLAASPAGGGLMGMARLPLWLVEGMAEYMSLGRVDEHTAMWLRDAALRGELPTIDQLTGDRRFFPYRYGQALWAYIGGRYGDRIVPEIYRFATRAGFEQALRRVVAITSDQLSEEWITAIRSTYLPLIEGRQRPEDAGDPIIVDDEIGAMNLSPSISPDGRYIAFYGRRDLFTIDLLLADAQTGEILKTLTSPARNQHMDALSFINSSGTWSPDGQKFAFIIYREGDGEITILDVASRDIERSINVDGVGGILHVAWSPDGRTIAFSGQSGGLSDLYLLDVESGSVRQVTDDRYADLQPTWSPDGRTIAFVTDRPGTNFERLSYGEMNIALMDASTLRPRVLELFSDSKHINPQFSPDGQSLYFISDHDGFSDVYRTSLADGSIYQVTRLATGVSGITAYSPALSVASGDGRVVFSVFENSGNNLYGLPAERAQGEPVVDRGPTRAIARILPPVGAAGTDLIANYLNDAVTGLPPTNDFPVSDYRPTLSLEYLGPPSFGVGASEYGVGIAGGVAGYFGDMLGNHFLGAAVQANGTFKDIGGQVVYVNSANRLNWGASALHLAYPQLFSVIGDGPDQNSFLYSEILARTYIDEATATTLYPFSMTRRAELGLSVTRYSFDYEIRRALISSTGRQLSPVEVIDTAGPDPIMFMQASTALVGDNSYFGFTSPVQGQRYRLELAPMFGELTMYTALLDYRRYSFFNPFTFAVRAFHFGRYGEDSDGTSDDGRRIFSPLFLGNPYLIRGYADDSFEIEECRPTPGISTCPVLSRLSGSRVAAVNIEFRIPLIGTQDYGLINFPFVPVEIAPFFDAGAAWSSSDGPLGLSDPLEFRFTRDTPERVPVFSAGVSARFNILGYLVLESYFVYPFQRPDKGWHFGFAMQPGW